MDTTNKERDHYMQFTSVLGGDEEEISAPGFLSLDNIEQVWFAMMNEI